MINAALMHSWAEITRYVIEAFKKGKFGVPDIQHHAKQLLLKRRIHRQHVYQFTMSTL